MDDLSEHFQLLLYFTLRTFVVFPKLNQFENTSGQVSVIILMDFSELEVLDKIENDDEKCV